MNDIEALTLIRWLMRKEGKPDDLKTAQQTLADFKAERK